MNFTEQKILITGASGSLGRQLIYELDHRGCAPICHVRDSSDTEYIDSLGLEKRALDLRRVDRFPALMEGIDSVIHTAAWVNFRKDRLTQFTGINTIGSLELFKAAVQAGVKRFVHVSTVASIGAAERKSNGEADTVSAQLDELSDYNLGHLKIPYIMTKRAAEDELFQVQERGDTELVVVNPAIIVAPSRTEDDRRAALNRFFNSFILPDFGNLINLVDLRDVAPGILAALESGRPGERYILGGDNLPVRKLILSATALLSKVPHLVRIPRPFLRLAARTAAARGAVYGHGQVDFYPELLKTLDYDWIYSSAKARRELNYHTRSVQATLRDLLENSFLGTWKRPVKVSR
ncbi:MAG: NAD-dependent epimerase/dehydratase family protein [bacterium]|nr:NAD-dependent epimerase/dehydratase family protein [bacterium]